MWRLEEINEEEVEAPKVPGGMTGGVENEAMQYCVGFCSDIILITSILTAISFTAAYSVTINESSC